MNRPEVHDVLRRWRALADGQDPRRVLVGETYVLDLDSLVPYYGQGEDELNLAFNFLFVHADLDAAGMRTIVEGVEAKLPEGAWPVYTGSNHDAGRLTTRWAGDDPRRARAALMMLLTPARHAVPLLRRRDRAARGAARPRTALDPVARRTGDPSRNRDVCRTPMPWTAEPGGGFTTAEATPWLPFGDLAACNVAAQREDPRLRAAPRARPDRAAPAALRADVGLLRAAAGAGRRMGLAARRSLRRGAEPVRLRRSRSRAWRGRVAVGDRSRTRRRAVGGELRLGPYEGVVIERAS